MVKKRIFYFDGSNGAAEKMIEILKHYADVAYPLGGSDCAATSRQALFDINNKIAEAQTSQQLAEIGRRQRPALKAAVNWYYTEIQKADDEIKTLLLSQLER